MDVDAKYLQLLGFDTTTQPYNVTRGNFSIVSYVLQNEVSSIILQLQNIATILPSSNFLIYDLGLLESDLQLLLSYCNTSTLKCSIQKQDFSQYPSYILQDEKLHLFRPILIKNALLKYRTILFVTNNVRFKCSSKVLNDIRKRTEYSSHVTSLEVKKLPITSKTHPRMFSYFNSDVDAFLFVRQVKLDAVFFHYSRFLDSKILLPWLKCVLTRQCIQPIGSNSNSNHCKFNKKPQYRYSGCHGFDESAFNIICGLTFNFNEAKYSVTDYNGPLFYKQSLDDSIRVLDNRRKNISETSEHPYSNSEE